MIEDERGENWLTASHEFGHMVAAAEFGFRLGPVTCIRGARLMGCAYAEPLKLPSRGDIDKALANLWCPYVSMPASLVERLNQTAVVLLAGRVAEDLLAGPAPAPELITGRVQEELPELPDPDDEETALLAAAVDEALPTETDDMKLDVLAEVAFRQDTASAAHWRSLMTDQAHELLDPSVARLRWLAEILLERGSLSTAAVVELLQQVRP
jgi:hypothetical protein